MPWPIVISCRAYSTRPPLRLPDARHMDAERRATLYETLDGGAVVVDAGLTDAGTTVTATIQASNAAAVDAARDLVAAGAVIVSTSRGVFSGFAARLTESSGTFSLEVWILEALT